MDDSASHRKATYGERASPPLVTAAAHWGSADSPASLFHRKSSADGKWRERWVGWGQGRSTPVPIPPVLVCHGPGCIRPVASMYVGRHERRGSRASLLQLRTLFVETKKSFVSLPSVHFHVPPSSERSEGGMPAAMAACALCRSVEACFSLISSLVRYCVLW